MLDNEPNEDMEDFDTSYRNRISQINDSIDELGRLARDARTLSQSLVGMTVSSSNLLASTSVNTIAEEADENSPPSPELHRKGLLNHKRATTVLSSKAPKRKKYFDMHSRSKKPMAELNISGPVGPVVRTGYAHSSRERTTNLSISRPNAPLKHTGSASHILERVETPIVHSGNAEGVSNPATTSADATHMERRITNLQNLAKQQNNMETANFKNGDKLSSLCRSKSMLLYAKQAVVRRFSSSAEKEAKMKAPDNTSLLDISPNDPDDQNRINRRIAEGKNLGSPKVQYLTGDGCVPRKPLPTYKSTESLRSDSSDDPFLDTTRIEGYVRSSYSQSNPDVDLSQHKNKRASIRIDSAHPPPMPKFSRTLSGLAQHGQVDIFSSSPVGSSTPRSRLEPQIDTDGKRGVTDTSDYRPSVVDFLSIDWGESDSEQPEHYCEVTGQQQKTTARALCTSRLHRTPKAEKGADFTTEDSSLSRIFGDPPKEHAPVLAPKHTNRNIPRASRDTNGTGLGIFYTGKGDAPLTDDTGILSKPARNRLAKSVKRSYIPKPVKAASDPLRSERETRTISPHDCTRDGETSMDELQEDVSAYQVGSRRKR